MFRAGFGRPETMTRPKDILICCDLRKNRTIGKIEKTEKIEKLQILVFGFFHFFDFLFF